MEVVKDSIALLGSLIAVVSVLAAVYFVFEAKRRSGRTWPELFCNPDPNKGRSS